jgi:hypothetical protein
LISELYKTIFIHIPKTGGTSIECKLGQFSSLKPGVQDHRTIGQIEPFNALDLLRLINPHKRNDFGFKEVVKQITSDHISNEKYNQYFKFTFVRNPWSRIHSWYLNVQRDPNHQKDYYYYNTITLYDFISRNFNRGSLKSQLYWITDKKGNIPLDFIGRFETLESDFKHIATRLSIKDLSLPHLLQYDHLPYRQCYDTKSIELVLSLYRKEIDYFNFCF